jgi:hypothetical protein
MTFRNVSYTAPSSGLISFASRNRRTVSLAVFPAICFEAICSSRSIRVAGTETEDATLEPAEGLERYFDSEAGVKWKRTFGSWMLPVRVKTECTVGLTSRASLADAGRIR